VGFCAFFKHFSGLEFFLLSGIFPARPLAGNANRSAAKVKMFIPRIGDEWEFIPTAKGKHKTIKKIVDIYWRPSQVTGRLCPYIKWSHQPKARYIGSIRVKNFLRDRAVRRISSAAEHSVHRICCRHCGKNVSINDALCSVCGTENPANR